MLLTIIRGPSSFEELLTFDGMVHPSCKATCILTAASLSVVDMVKRNLAEMSTSIVLEAFHESLIHARMENRKRTYMGLSVGDLLKSLEGNLERSRREIDVW
jgi:hypothetical protein